MSRNASPCCACAALGIAAWVLGMAPAAAQPADAPASMSRPSTGAARNAGNSAKPDNMPIKRPKTPPRDRMLHDHPSSDALAK